MPSGRRPGNVSGCHGRWREVAWRGHAKELPKNSQERLRSAHCPTFSPRCTLLCQPSASSPTPGPVTLATPIPKRVQTWWVLGAARCRGGAGRDHKCACVCVRSRRSGRLNMGPHSDANWWACTWLADSQPSCFLCYVPLSPMQGESEYKTWPVIFGSGSTPSRENASFTIRPPRMPRKVGPRRYCGSQLSLSMRRCHAALQRSRRSS